MSSLAAAAAATDSSAELSGDQLGAEFWKSKYQQLEQHCKVINEQKVRPNHHLMTRMCYAWIMRKIQASSP